MTYTRRSQRCVLIALEGVDRSGKSTQAAMLAAWARRMKYRTQLLKFPDYSLPTGRRIKRLLGSGAEPAEIHSLMAENRREALPGLLRAMRRSNVLVMDRYTGSNIAYGVANGLDRGWLAALDRSMPKPDATILIDVDVTESFRRRPGGDTFESDIGFMRRAAAEYRRAARAGGWFVVRSRGDPLSVHDCVARCAARALRGLRSA